jgi:hypothetical protein
MEALTDTLIARVDRLVEAARIRFSRQGRSRHGTPLRHPGSCRCSSSTSSTPRPPQSLRRESLEGLGDAGSGRRVAIGVLMVVAGLAAPAIVIITRASRPTASLR